MINKTETIAAISTAMTNSGIGIVRISGDDAVKIIKRIFRPFKAKDLDEAASFTVHYGNIVDGDTVVDEVLVLLMRAPHTYTREDVVEIDCHGGIFVIKKILELVLKNGARPAEPGEFTKRAFVNGRIDLSQAEAVIDLINAENDYALKSALTQLKGSVSSKIREIRAVLLENTAYIEAALDDPEHIEMDGFGEELLPVIKDIQAQLEELIETSDNGRIIKEGIKTVIVGKPNVGKSSLLNALLGCNRAIVTDIAGTTRDTLEESISLGDVSLNIVDTAGIRDTDDIIEKIGVDKARKVAEDADLIVFLVDSSKPIDDDDREIMEMIKGRKAIVLVNKTDLPRKADTAEILSNLECPVIETSITENVGIDEFVSAIKEMFYNGEVDFNNQVFITNARHKAALFAASESLTRTAESIENGLSEDFYTIDMMDAYESLGQIIGEAIEDDLADEIFSKFCMGK